MICSGLMTQHVFQFFENHLHPAIKTMDVMLHCESTYARLPDFTMLQPCHVAGSR